MVPRLTLFNIMTVLLALTAGCGGGTPGFDEYRVRMLLEVEPMTIDAEQVAITPTQFECGVRADLWQAPRQASPERSSAALTPSGKAFSFEDEVWVKEAGFRHPYVQVRGKFPLKVKELGAITDGPESIKLVEMKVGVVIDHSCFTQPLPLMGVRHGKFSQDADPVFQFRLQPDGWIFDRIRH